MVEVNRRHERIAERGRRGKTRFLWGRAREKRGQGSKRLVVCKRSGFLGPVAGFGLNVGDDVTAASAKFTGLSRCTGT